MKRLLFKNYLSSYQDALNEALRLQENVFNYLIEQGSRTFYGLINNFSQIRTYKDYQKFVPIAKYEDLWPYIERNLRTQKSCLWPKKTKFFAQSSGTTSAKKIIPLSLEALKSNHVLAGRILFANYCLNLNPNFRPLSGKSFALAGSRQHNSDYPNAYIADVSAILLENLPLWANYFTAPANSIATSGMHWENKLTAIANDLKDRNVISLSGVPSWMMRVLETSLKISGKEKIIELWPNLSLFIHGGVNFAPYKSRFTELVGRPIDCINSYNSSEGFFAFQDSLESDAMLLLPNVGVFYEFRALNSELAIPLSQVEKNKVYALIISTNSGLWRYEIGDTIEFTSLNPYRIQIIGRTKQCINLTGEELMVNQAEQALAFASALLDLGSIEYTVAPLIENGKNYHEWLIETQSYFLVSQLSKLIDGQLQDLNADYKAKRVGGLLELPRITILAPNTFANYLKGADRLGGQNKVPRLRNDRSFIDELFKK